ncbi:low affinity immunoglobulin gamma Fc region receptor II-c-like [Perca fluviatilis]|uniref:low affinity immunoglobulin gamma Fc region receptor II-c-like n=1 Tax=Perca fluviatilis TaxID=8168 RepID=UPI0019628A1D|nr:low affinity immunoglobulin gamma Fc region receptor II-c-like [Perca fluviatilis]
MEVTALCIRLLMLGFTQIVSDAAFLSTSPNKLQHFEYDSVTFKCDGTSGSTRLRGTRNYEEFKPVCDIKKTPSGSSCTIDKIYQADSGEYWCETEGVRSNTVNISVTAGSVILESPVLPVMEGETVTLRCRNKTSSTNLPADFYKGGHLMNSSGEEMTIENVSKSDEGLYKCRISGAGESAESWLAVRAKNTSTIPQSPNNPPRALILLWITVTVFMVALVLLLVGFLHMRRHKASSKTPAAASHSGEVL